LKQEGEYYYLPMEECLEKISDCYEIKKILKFYIKDNIDNEEAWDSSLMTLLCEYYSISARFTELMSELILTPPSIDEVSGKEVITVDSHKYAILSSYSKLMIVNEVELKYEYKVHLFIQ